MKNGYLIGSVPYKPSWFEKALESILKEYGFVLGKPEIVIDQELGIFERVFELKDFHLFYKKDFNDPCERIKYQELFQSPTIKSKNQLAKYFLKDFHNASLTHENAGTIINDDDFYYSVEIEKSKLTYLYIESEISINPLISMIKSYIKNHTTCKIIPSYCEHLVSEIRSSLILGGSFTYNIESILSNMPFLKKDIEFSKTEFNNNQYLFYLFFSAILESAFKIEAKTQVASI